MILRAERVGYDSDAMEFDAKEFDAEACAGSSLPAYCCLDLFATPALPYAHSMQIVHNHTCRAPDSTPTAHRSCVHCLPFSCRSCASTSTAATWASTWRR